MKIGLRLPVRPESVTAARHSLNGLSQLVPEELLDQLQLLVSELVTNSIRHAGLTMTDWIDVEVSVSDQRARIEVADPGVSFRPPSDPSPAETSGFGLFLVQQMSSRWGVRTGDVTSVWAELQLSPA